MGDSDDSFEDARLSRKRRRTETPESFSSQSQRIVDNNMASNGNTDEDLIKIMIATDLHIGYMEKDAIRSRDTLNSFEEVLQIATDKKVDMVLLGGDLFDENKPSPSMFHSVIRLLRNFCLNNRAVKIKFVSDASENFKHSQFPTVNYEDPNLNVGMPIFSIHGNHDDLGGSGNCALDLVHETGLINFFGKFTDVGNAIRIMPLLFEKGSTKLALYGLGYQKDDRLHRKFTANQVHFFRPDENRQDWFSIFALHQNREKCGRMNSYIPERFLPTFLDVILWGHEHACKIGSAESGLEKLSRSDGGEDIKMDGDELGEDPGWVIQPGSTVITQLNQQEFENKKYVGVLHVKGKRLKLEKVKLKTVRPFYFEQIVLSDEELPEIPADKILSSRGTAGSSRSKKFHTQTLSEGEAEYKKITTLLTKKVDDLVEQAANDRNGHPKQPKEPLIRLRVDFTGFNDSIFSTMAFGQRYIGKVANPKDLILIHRTKEGKERVKLDRNAFDDVTKKTAQELQASVEDVVTQYFEHVEKDDERMLVLYERTMSAGVDRYVNKDNKDALKVVFDHDTKEMTNIMKLNLDKIEDEKDVREILEQLRQTRLERRKKFDDKKKLEEQDRAERSKMTEILDRSQTQRPSRNFDDQNNDDDDFSPVESEDEDDGATPFGSSSRGGRGRGGRGRPRGSRARGAGAGGASGRGRGGRGRGAARGKGSSAYAEVTQDWTPGREVRGRDESWRQMDRTRDLSGLFGTQASGKNTTQRSKRGADESRLSLLDDEEITTVPDSLDSDDGRSSKRSKRSTLSFLQRN